MNLIQASEVMHLWRSNSDRADRVNVRELRGVDVHRDFVVQVYYSQKKNGNGDG